VCSSARERRRDGALEHEWRESITPTNACSTREQETSMVMEQQLLDDGTAPVYRRELPGGGYVAIDVRRGREVARTSVSVERRAIHERRDGHVPVVIAEAEGDDRSPGFAELYRLAADNAAIARALLQIVGPSRGD
jgi:hypothetical protein